MKEENPRIIVLNLFGFMITFAESSDFFFARKVIKIGYFEQITNSIP